MTSLERDFLRVLKMQMCSSDRQGLPSHTSIPLSLFSHFKKPFFAHFLDLADASSRYIREGEGSGGALCQKRRVFFCRPCCCCLGFFTKEKFVREHIIKFHTIRRNKFLLCRFLCVNLYVGLRVRNSTSQIFLVFLIESGHARRRK